MYVTTLISTVIKSLDIYKIMNDAWLTSSMYRNGKSISIIIIYMHVTPKFYHHHYSLIQCIFWQTVAIMTY